MREKIAPKKGFPSMIYADCDVHYTNNAVHEESFLHSACLKRHCPCFYHVFQQVLQVDL
jgi:hypothetical protein